MCSSWGAPVVCSSTGHRCRSRIRPRCTPSHFLPLGKVVLCCEDSCVPVFGAKCRRQLWQRTRPQVHRRGFGEQLILRVALEHDAERAHPSVSRFLFEQNDDASDGHKRFTDLQHESDFVLQLGCWGEDVASEAWYNQRAGVDRELGAVAVADGEQDDTGADSIDCVFPGGWDLFRRQGMTPTHHCRPVALRLWCWG